MTTIFDRIKEEVSEPSLVDDTEIQNMFAKFYDEIDELKERDGTDVKQLDWLQDTYIIPMLTNADTIATYKEAAYKTREREFYEMRQEERDEMDFACENGMDAEYWCEKCKVGICDEH